jgi:hypothetical protein
MQPEDQKTDYYWHPFVHEEWAKEKLYFWRLGFSPTYDRDRIVNGIRQALDRHNATVFTIYELCAGEHDMFLRVWLVDHPDAFQTTLYTTLAERGFQVTPERFHVDRIIVHWPWEAEPNSLTMRPLCVHAPYDPLPDAEIAKINSGAITESQSMVYQKHNLITPVWPTLGVKFFTVIGQHRALNLGDRERLEARIKEVFREAASIYDKSLYAGLGLGEYLLMGRASDYFAIEREVTVPLNKSVDFNGFGARTMTHPCSREEFLDARYDLKVNNNQAPTLGA